MYPDQQTREIMANYQHTNSFEAAPQKQSFHELFQTLVEFRSNKVNQNVSKLLRTMDESRNVLYPDASKYLQSSFDSIMNREIPRVDSRHPIDTEDMLQSSGTVQVDQVRFPADMNDTLNLAKETEDERVAAARQNLAYVNELSKLKNEQINTYTDNNFTLAA